MSTFLENLKFGERYENLFIDKYLETHVKKISNQELENIELHPDGSFKDWDMRVTLSDQSIKTYEVKSCRNSYKSKMMCLEFSFRDKPSGIAATKSDYFVYISIINELEENCYVIPTCILKEKLQSGKYREITGGRIKQSKCILIPLREVEKYLI